MSGLYRWKESNWLSRPVIHDFSLIETLKLAEKTFHRVGIEFDEA